MYVLYFFTGLRLVEDDCSLTAAGFSPPELIRMNFKKIAPLTDRIPTSASEIAKLLKIFLLHKYCNYTYILTPTSRDSRL